MSGVGGGVAFCVIEELRGDIVGAGIGTSTTTNKKVISMQSVSVSTVNEIEDPNIN